MRFILRWNKHIWVGSKEKRHARPKSKTLKRNAPPDKYENRRQPRREKCATLQTKSRCYRSTHPTKCKKTTRNETNHYAHGKVALKNCCTAKHKRSRGVPPFRNGGTAGERSLGIGLGVHDACGWSSDRIGAQGEDIMASCSFCFCSSYAPLSPNARLSRGAGGPGTPPRK